MKDFVGSLTAEQRERALSLTFEDQGIRSWHEKQIFKKFWRCSQPLTNCDGADQHCLWASKAQL